MRRVLALLVLLLLLTACGVDAQDRPEGVDIPEPSTTEPPRATDGGGREVTVFFVRGARLEPAARSSERVDVTSVLELLVTGPTRPEVIGGLRTALAPQALTPESSGTADPVVTIAVTREFTDVAGGNQLLAVAQVVWTVTQLPDVDLVRVTSDGQPVEVPTDQGLTDQPVGRSDYLSVAPAGEEPPTATPAPIPPPSSAPSTTDE